METTTDAELETIPYSGPPETMESPPLLEPAVDPTCAECGEPARYLVSGRGQPESGVCRAHLEEAMESLSSATVRLVAGKEAWLWCRP
jgi:hypothetical protein